MGTGRLRRKYPDDLASLAGFEPAISPDHIRGLHPCQPHLQPPDVAVEVFRGRPAKRLDELTTMGVDRVHILDVIAAGRDKSSRLAYHHEVLQAACRREALVAIAAVRAEHGIAGHQRHHRALHRRAFAV